MGLNDKMAKTNTATNIIIEEQPSSIIEEYNELNSKCDDIIKKLRKRKTRKNARKY